MKIRDVTKAWHFNALLTLSATTLFSPPPPYMGVKYRENNVTLVALKEKSMKEKCKYLIKINRPK